MPQRLGEVEPASSNTPSLPLKSGLEIFSSEGTDANGPARQCWVRKASKDRVQPSRGTRRTAQSLTDFFNFFGRSW